MTATLDTSHYPRLRPGWVYAEHDAGALLLNTLRATAPLIIKGDTGKLLAVLDLCTGEADLGHIGHTVGLPGSSLATLVSSLQRREVLRLHPAEVVDPYTELPRYVRQLEYLEDKLGDPETVAAAQRRLLSTHVTVIGLGGVAHWLLTALAAVGVRRLRLLDPDDVELSNLSRQFLFDLESVGRPKVHAAADRLRRTDSDFDIEPVATGVWNVEDAERAVAGTDLAVVTVGHVPSRITSVTNRAAVSAGVPLMLVGGMTWGPLVMPGTTPCVACLESLLRASSPLTFDTLAERSPRFPTGTHTPVLTTAIAPAAIGAADDLINFLTGAGRPRSLGAVIRADAPANPIPLSTVDDCAVCGGRP